MGLLDRGFCSEDKLCGGELRYLGYRRRVTVFYLRYKIYYKVGHLMTEYLHDILASLNTRPSAALDELASLVVPRCRTDHFSLSFLPVDVVCGTCYRRMCLDVEP